MTKGTASKWVVKEHILFAEDAVNMRIIFKKGCVQPVALEKLQKSENTTGLELKLK